MALDGEYVRRRGVLFDMRCFFGTFSKLSGTEVVESEVPEESSRDAEVSS